MTPLSGAAAYCTPAQLVERYDYRIFADKLSDNRQRLVLADVLASTTLADLLKQASGWIESVCLVGNRYLPTDLAALTGNSAQLLVGICADLTIFLIYDRRGDANKMPIRAQIAMSWLDKLEEGRAIFGTQEAANAGLPEVPVEIAADVETRNLSTYQARRLFGDRSNRSGQ